MNIGVVAIGRNEGPRLVACLRSALRDAKTVVYVDSGSTDASAATAREMGAHVVALEMSIPFTAARARNEGLARLLQIDPTIELVQFVDGDCEIVDGWIDQAQAFLSTKPPAAAVCGRRRERFPNATLYNAMCDIEWNTPIGQTKYCGGDVLMRADALRQVNGYDPSIIAGEEPEMCVRLRAEGWTIHRIDAEMTLHDAAMTRFSQWWKRMVRGGHAYAEGYAMHGAAPERHRVKETRSNWFWGLLLPATIVLSTAVLTSVNRKWGWLGLLPAVLYLALFGKVFLSARRRGLGHSISLRYGLLIVIGKLPMAIGQMTYYFNRMRGRRTRLIEYKGSGAAASGGAVP